MTKTPSLHSDVLIVGGGMAGGLLALLLADQGLTVRVLDGAAEPVWPEGAPALRVSTLNEASYWLLRHTGAWQYLNSQRVQPYRHMQVWDHDGTGEVNFDVTEAGAEALGWLLENDHIVAALYRAGTDRERLDWQCGAPVAAVRRTPEGWRVSAGDGDYSADLVVGADGARSLVREAAGIPGGPRDTGHHALVATIETERPHGGCARQVFLESGPLALLPLFDAAADAEEGAGGGRHCSIVWSGWPGFIEERLAEDDDAFARALNQATAEVLGPARPVSPRRVFPIQERHASSYRAPGLALVGDAAHVIHPLAGQGINLGFLDVGVLAEELARVRQAGLPLADPAALARYERRRRADNLLMQQAMRGFKILFERREPALRWLRNTGLGMVDKLPPARRLFIEHALGRAGDLPRLARPCQSIMEP
ncbi:Oxygenase [Alloalcanivorax dieselolei B5]|uniref:Oxygenase n=1 Tax=Alcanivorax dieselolei (strain DSM 16502 / CGMCC 1.3690 / MCCC 1A00001 / B-5) TaxID=930169 RepID=K0C581_ALCDB|nr:FAD-dependent monooxygenase [Alloalcanivorax dieselolei]AFT68574.1 Oxygenase [Alloalcanivorax dieselolei B5]GGJ98598.1 2-octaprenyl-3-methyl-6-methoxy-1,4-benzoquinol hydroxylase [Alloalcanivorax dieselolei]